MITTTRCQHLPSLYYRRLTVILNCGCTLNPSALDLTPAASHQALSAYFFSFPHPSLWLLHPNGHPLPYQLPQGGHRHLVLRCHPLLLHSSLSILNCILPAEPNSGPGGYCYHFQRYSPYPVIPKSKLLNNQRSENAILEKLKPSS